MDWLALLSRRLDWVRVIPPGSRLLLGVLFVASLLSSCLVAGRILATGQLRFLFLPFNLALAWIPLLLAGALWRLHIKSQRRTCPFAFGLLLWLCFLPNAPYLVTDLIHLRPRPPMPVWIDLVIFVSFLWVGVILGFFSLYLMQRMVAERFSFVGGWLFALTILTLTALGIYIGRMLRWNSWDLLFRPLSLANDLCATFRHPRANPQPYVYTALYSQLLLIFYVSLYSLTRFRLDSGRIVPAFPVKISPP